MNFEIAAALATTLLATSAFVQTPKLATDEMMVKSPDADIEIYVRNKRPTDMTSFRPERTLLYVHGATYRCRDAERRTAMPTSNFGTWNEWLQTGRDRQSSSRIDFVACASEQRVCG